MVAIAAAAIPTLLRLVASSGVARDAVKQVGGASKELFGYDFVGLLTKIIVLQLIAYLFAKFMEAVIFGNNFVNSFILGAARLFGVKIPEKSTFPPLLVQLFETGYGEHKIKYWDFVKALTTALIVFEALQYYRINKQAGAQVSPMTLGIFTLLIGGMGLVTIPEIVNRFKGSENIHLKESNGVPLSSIDGAVEGLVPNKEVIYGWKGINVGTQQYVTRPDGWVYFILIVPQEPIGVYTLYFDQRPWGGPYYERKFEIVEVPLTV